MATSPTPSTLDLFRSGNYRAVISRFEAQKRAQASIDEGDAGVVAAAYAQTGDLTRAREVLEPFLKATSTAKPTTYALAIRLALDQRDHQTAFDLSCTSLNAYYEDLSQWQRLVRTAVDAGMERRALAFVEKLRIQPWNDPELAICYATLLTRGHSSGAGRALFEQLLHRWPNHPVASRVYRELILRDFPREARRAFTETPCRLETRTFDAITVRAALKTPAFYEREEDAIYWREELLSALAQLTNVLDACPFPPWKRLEAIESAPLWLAYHDGNIRPAREAWGAFIAKVAAPAAASVIEASSQSEHDEANRSAVARKVRIGVVSNRLAKSSAATYFNPWIDALLGEDCEVFLYSLELRDETTESYGARASRW